MHDVQLKIQSHAQMNEKHQEQNVFKGIQEA